jgi:hypothetical protein
MDFPGDLAVDEGRYETAAELYGKALRHNQLVSFHAGMSWVAQRSAILAIRMGDTRLGVRILAATHEIGATTLRGNVPELAFERRRALDHARVVVGDQSFGDECSTGRTLTLEEAVLDAGDLYFQPPGHTAIVDEDYEAVEFSPPAAHEQVLDVIKRNAPIPPPATA